jgi:hypothetical protein
MKSRCFFVLMAAAIAAAAPALAAEAPRGFSIQQTPSGVTVAFDGKTFAGYVIDRANKPYVWPIVGPTGKQMTRGYPLVDRPSEPEQQRDHPHHRGLTFGHEDYAGDTWHDRSTYEAGLADPEKEARARQAIAHLGSIKHRAFTVLEAGPERAIVESTCDHIGPSGHVNLTERRRLTFRATATTRTIDVDQDLVGGDKPVRIGDRKDAGLFIRRLVEAGPLVRLSRPDRWREARHRVPRSSIEFPASHTLACPHLRPLHGESIRQPVLRSEPPRRRDHARAGRDAPAPPPSHLPLGRRA